MGTMECDDGDKMNIHIDVKDGNDNDGDYGMIWKNAYEDICQENARNNNENEYWMHCQIVMEAIQEQEQQKQQQQQQSIGGGGAMMNAGCVYAHVISALEHDLLNNDGEGANKKQTSHAALLQVLEWTIPHVSFTLVRATLLKISRVLRGMMKLYDNHADATDNTMQEDTTQVDDEEENDNDEMLELLQQACLSCMARTILKVASSSSQEEEAKKRLLHQGMLHYLQISPTQLNNKASSLSLLIMTTLVKALASSSSSSQQEQQEEVAMDWMANQVSAFIHKVLLRYTKQLTSTNPSAETVSKIVPFTRSLLHFLELLYQGVSNDEGNLLFFLARRNHEDNMNKIATALMELWVSLVAQYRQQRSLIAQGSAGLAHDDYILAGATTNPFLQHFKHQDDNNIILLLQKSCNTILSIFSQVFQDQQQQQHLSSSTAATDNKNDTSNLAVRVLASLLQHVNTTPKHFTFPSRLEWEGRALQGRLILLTSQHLVSSFQQQQKQKEGDLERLVKFLPLVMRICLVLIRPNNNDNNALVELQQEPQQSQQKRQETTMIMTIMGQLSQWFRTAIMTQQQQQKDTNNVWRTLLLESKCGLEMLQALSALVTATKEDKDAATSLPLYQSTWFASLKPLVLWMQLIHVVVLKEDTTTRKQELWAQMKQVVESLIQLHNKEQVRQQEQQLGADSVGQQQQQHLANLREALSSLFQGIGLESSWLLISWQQQGTSNQATNVVLVSPIRAWLLPLLYSSCMTTLTVRDDYDEDDDKDDEDDDSSSNVSRDNDEDSTNALPSSNNAQQHHYHLDFFQTKVLPVARSCDVALSQHLQSKQKSSFYHSCVLDLWKLLHIVCQNPIDVDSSSSTDLVQTLVRALGDNERYPQLGTIICQGLVRLGNFSLGQNKVVALSNQTKNLLPALFKQVELTSAALSNHNKNKPANNDQDGMNVDKETEKDKDNSPSTSGASLSLFSHKLQTTTNAITVLAKLAPTKYLETLFKKILQRLLTTTTSDATDSSDTNAMAKVYAFLCLAQAVVSSRALEEASMSLLYRALKPLILSNHHHQQRTNGNGAAVATAGRIQKRAYKVLLELCRNYTGMFVTSQSDDSRQEQLLLQGEMMEFFKDTILTCPVSARTMRLQCMTILVAKDNARDHFCASQNQTSPCFWSNLMGEVILCVKDTNAKAREAAYHLLIAMSKAFERHGASNDFYKVLIAALGAQTPHMRSATVMAMSRLVYEYKQNNHNKRQFRFDDSSNDMMMMTNDGDMMGDVLLPQMLSTILILLKEPSREVVKSVVGFIRVSIVAMTREQLEPMLGDIVGGMLQDHTIGKDRFRAKIKIILKKLVRKFGYDALAPHVPANDSRLLTHIRKLSQRAARKAAAAAQEEEEDEGDFDEMMESEDDSDNGRTLVSGMTRTTRRTIKTKSRRSVASATTKKSAYSTSSRRARQYLQQHAGIRIKNDSSGVLDMTDPQFVSKNVQFSNKKVHFDDDSDMDDDNDLKFDDMGRLIVPNDQENDNNDGPIVGSIHGIGDDDSDDEDDHDVLMMRHGGKRRKVAEAMSRRSKAKSATASSKRNNSKKVRSLGAAYKSKKAGGDVKRKGQKYEPYAYVPLDGKSYSKKKRQKTVAQMSTVVRGGKRKRKS